MKALIIIAGIIAYLGLILLLIRFFAVCAGREPGLPINGTDSQQRFGEADSHGVGGGADRINHNGDVTDA